MRSIYYMEVRDRIREITNFQEDGEMLIRASDKIMEMVYIARKEGLLAMEEERNHLGEEDFLHYFREMLLFLVEGVEPDTIQDICLSKYFTLDLKGAEGLVFLIFLTGTLAIQAGESEYVVTKRLQSLLPAQVLESYKPKTWNVEPSHIERMEQLCQREPTFDRKSDDYFLSHMADYTFANLTDADMQRLLKDVKNNDLVIALKGMDGKASKKIFANLNPALQKMIVEDLDYMGPVRAVDVIASKQKILNILVNLIGNGEINGDNYSHLSAFM